MGDQVDSEEVVNRFSLPLEEYEVDETEEIKPFGASPEQQHEYRLAFSIVSRGKDTVTAAQINDVYLALGYTLQVSDLETVVGNCVPDDSGRYPCDNTLEAYDLFKRDMMDERCVVRGHLFSVDGSSSFGRNIYPPPLSRIVPHTHAGPLLGLYTSRYVLLRFSAMAACIWKASSRTRMPSATHEPGRGATYLGGSGGGGMRRSIAIPNARTRAPPDSGPGPM